MHELVFFFLPGGVYPVNFEFSKTLHPTTQEQKLSFCFTSLGSLQQCT